MPSLTTTTYPPKRLHCWVVHLATGATDVLSGRSIRATDDLDQMVARAGEIQQQELYVLREHE